MNRAVATTWCLAGVVLASGAVGCSTETVYIDPPVDRSGQGSDVVTGDPLLVIGFYEEQLYTELEEEGECPIVHGLQGGTWIMPALRIQGIGSPAATQCRVTLDDGEQVGAAAAVEDYYVGGDGFLEVTAFPVPINHSAPGAGPGIDDLFGQGAEMWCRVEDEEERGAELTVAVTLVEG